MTEEHGYIKKTNDEIECVKYEQKQYHGSIVEGYKCQDGCEYDSMGLSDYWNVRECPCSECGEYCSSFELKLFRKHSKVKDKDLCKDCHARETANLTNKDMAEILMEYLPCQKDNDIVWTLENQFKRRCDLAFMLMAVSNQKYTVSDSDY